MDVDVLALPIPELLDRVRTALVSKDSRIATLQIEVERLEKARERADEDAATDLRIEKERYHRLVQQTEAAEALVQSLRQTLKASEESRIATVTRLDTVETLAGDAQRSLELGDKNGAEGCLREITRQETMETRP